MLHNKPLVWTIGLLSVVAGYMYRNGKLATLGLPVMDLELGIDRHMAVVWGNCSMLFGLALTVFLLLRFRMKAPIRESHLQLLLSLVFIIQLPPFGLWFMPMLLNEPSAVPGAVFHASLLLLISIAFVTQGRTPAFVAMDMTEIDRT
ncbi:hypothetical protein RB620_28210 [Paenibacillus sp. LHD-117]|uniref:hypothetical protein n=1 Tax=Paenibacillus sp. LHD-117 TaxID=3071412 RepID=UPI0027E15C32|nr:hypothetical protein [Paenibacillus sp. LHD-117]MDQ6423319.1 hypothetical protein [Paenibacillus sp. LHD-117]